jgi:hypothetical protein
MQADAATEAMVDAAYAASPQAMHAVKDYSDSAFCLLKSSTRYASKSA